MDANLNWHGGSGAHCVPVRKTPESAVTAYTSFLALLLHEEHSSEGVRDKAR